MALSFLLVTACNSSEIKKSNISAEQAEKIAECRVVQHIMGETCVPKNPQRLIAISRFALAHTLVLGVKPIGSTLDYQYPLYLKNRITGIDQIGEMYEPNLEKIMLLKPDLILGWETSRSIYPILSQISPTVLFKWDGTSSWQEHFNFVAKILGKQEAAREALKHYYQRTEKLKTDLSNRYKNKKISIFEIYGGMRIYPDDKSSFAASILEDVGLQIKTQSNKELSTGPLSEEKLEEVDGDLIFVLIFSDRTNESREAFEELQQKSLWQKLRAVQNGRVYLVDRETWVGSNLIAADLVIDDLYKYLVNTP
ncbi:MAG: iron-siderophore ABC transporter substrate-binding protein [Cyanosarcina radialis HA8281-LM2]|nr:iron-siderophore ABC transporter substrate-binding protein [Cyanosarcina radialis HA8281-LM2]